MNRSRTLEPAPVAESSPVRGNPLREMLSGGPFDAPLIVERLQLLPNNEESAHWVDQLLDDPRLDNWPTVREAAVKTLLEFGHPWALLINPDDLERYRKTRRVDIRHVRITFGAGAGVVAALAAPYQFDLEMMGAGFAAFATSWALTVAVRAVFRIGLTRWWLMAEVVTGLVAAVLTLESGATVGAVALLAAVVPVALAGLAGGWTEP